MIPVLAVISKSDVITPFIGPITPATHLFSAIQKKASHLQLPGYECRHHWVEAADHPMASRPVGRSTDF